MVLCGPKHTHTHIHIVNEQDKAASGYDHVEHNLLIQVVCQHKTINYDTTSFMAHLRTEQHRSCNRKYVAANTALVRPGQHHQIGNAQQWQQHQQRF